MFTIEDIAKAIRDENLSDAQLYKRFGGFSIYIPKVKPNYKDNIIAEFNGYNHYILATKYNVSINQIYKILRENRPKQGGLFDNEIS